jgi:DNA-binding MarR family transcriptional regulator
LSEPTAFPAGDSRAALIARILELEPAMHRAMGPSQPAFWLDVELSMSQLKLLFVLQHAEAGNAEGVRVGELARALGVTLPTASVVLDRLVERELVRRDEARDDRRQKVCRLTEAGRALLDRLAAGSRLHTAALLAYLDSDSLALVCRTMELLIEASNRLREGMTPGLPALLSEGAASAPGGVEPTGGATPSDEPSDEPAEPLIWPSTPSTGASA